MNNQNRLFLKTERDGFCLQILLMREIRSNNADELIVQKDHPVVCLSVLVIMSEKPVKTLAPLS